MRRFSWVIWVIVVLIGACTQQSVATQTSPVVTYYTTEGTSPAGTPPASDGIVMPNAWASDKTGRVQPSELFPVVGGINYRHHRTLDVMYFSLRLAVIGDMEFSQLDALTQKAARAQVALTLNQDNGLMTRLSAVRAALARQANNNNVSIVVVSGTMPVEIVQYPAGVAISTLPPEQRFLISEQGDLIENTQPVALLPGLMVSGKDIIRTDTSEVLLLQGGTINRGAIVDGAWHTDTSIDKALLIARVAKTWGANFVRVPYVSSMVHTRLADFLQLAKETQRLGMYIAFTAASKTGAYSDIEVPDDELLADEVYLAQNLKGYHHVLMDLYNEPHPPETPAGVAAYNAALLNGIDVLRKAGVDSPVILPGNFWSLSFRAIDLARLTDENVIFRPFDNAWVGAELTLTLKADQDVNGSPYDHRKEWQFLLDPQITPHGAVMIGAFGFGRNSPLRRQEIEGQWIDGTLNLARERAINFSASDIIDPDTWVPGAVDDPRAIPEANLPTGRKVRAYLLSYPPMQFTK